MAEETVPSEKEIIRDFLEYFLGDDGPFSDVVWDNICIHQARAMSRAEKSADAFRERKLMMNLFLSLLFQNGLYSNSSE